MSLLIAQLFTQLSWFHKNWMLLSLISDKPEKQVQHMVKHVASDRQWLTEENNKQLFGERQATWRVLYGSSGIILKVTVQSLPLKDTYTKPSAADTGDLWVHLSSITVFVTALSKRQHNKDQGKAQRVKTDAASFSVAPRPWKVVTEHSTQLQVRCPFCHTQNNVTSRRAQMPLYL